MVEIGAWGCRIAFATGKDRCGLGDQHMHFRLSLSLYRPMAGSMNREALSTPIWESTANKVRGPAPEDC